MSKIIFAAAVVLSVALIIGCEEVAKDDPRFFVSPQEMAIAAGHGFAVAQPEEVDLVENMAAHRSAYRAGLEKLVDYYQQAGDAVKLRWAKRELAIPVMHYRYLMPAEIASVNLRATEKNVEANYLYWEAVELHEKGKGLLGADDQKLREALDKFNLLISKFPASDKIDDVAYKAARIYEHFGDYEIAAVYYQRAFQWDDETPYPTRFKAAHILDQRLHMRKDALSLYRLAYEREAQYMANTEYAMKRILALTKPGETEAEAQSGAEFQAEE